MLEERVSDLTAAINQLNDTLKAAYSLATTAPADTDKAKSKAHVEAQTSEQTKAKAKLQPEPEPEAANEPDWADDEPETPEPEYVVDDVRRVIGPLGKEKGIALLAEFKATKLSEVKPSDYAALIKAAKAARG